MSAAFSGHARASIGARLLAFCIDLVLVHILVAIAGLAATVITSGTVRISGSVVNVVDCAASPVPPGVAAAHGFGASDGFLCTRAIPGFVHDRMLVLREKATTGEDDGDRRTVSIAVDEKGNPTRAFYVDRLIPLALAVYLLLLEWRSGTTPGKRVLGIHVQKLDGSAIGIAQGAKRLVRLVALLSASSAQELPVLTGRVHRVGLSSPLHSGLPDFGDWTILAVLLAWGFIVSFIVMIWRGRQPLHDLWAGTEVVRDDARDGPRVRPVAH